VAARAAMPEIRKWMPAPATVIAAVLEPALNATIVPQTDWQSATQPAPLKT
jgi:hypothetical protein